MRFCEFQTLAKTELRSAVWWRFSQLSSLTRVAHLRVHTSALRIQTEARSFAVLNAVADHETTPRALECNVLEWLKFIVEHIQFQV